MTEHFLRHSPPDPGELLGQIETLRLQIDAARDPVTLIDRVGTLVGALTAARREAEAAELGFPYLPVARSNPEHEESAWLVHSLATAVQYLGQYGEANALFNEALLLCRQHGWRTLEHFVLHHWGRSQAEEGEFDAAERLFRESLSIRSAMADPRVQSSQAALSELALLRAKRFST